MRPQIILRFTGISILFVSALMLVSLLISLIHGADASTMPLLISAIVTGLAGFIPLKFIKPVPRIYDEEGVYIVVFSWIASCIFGMLPFLLYGHEFSFTNALFESISGFTTTGASILNDIEALPLGLLFWRTATAWVGGIGIVTIFSMMVPKAWGASKILSGAEISDLVRRQSTKRGKEFVKSVLLVYVSMTMLCCILLRISGLTWFDAMTNAMSACSTCGFCIRNASIGTYNNLGAEIILMFFMTFSGISFVEMYKLTNKNSDNRFEIFKSEVVKVYLIIIALGIALLTADLYIHETYGNIWEGLRYASFQVCSIVTTTGFATTDTTLWPALSIIVITLASVFCGCSGSTSGGVKVDRLVVLIGYIRIRILTMIHPRLVKRIKIEGKVMNETKINAILSFIFLYMGSLIAGSVINIMGGLDLTTGITASVACLGNVGPGFGSVGSMGNYADLPDLLKYNSMFLMIAGRLEIMPLLIALALPSQLRQ